MNALFQTKAKRNSRDAMRVKHTDGMTSVHALCAREVKRWSYRAIIRMGLSIRAYARYRGVTDTAVHKAIRAGRITPEADGSIDAAKADSEWVRNSAPPRTGTQARAPRVALPESADTVRDAGTAALPVGGASLLQARTVNEVVKAQTNKVRLARLKGELVERSQVVAHVFKLARDERDAWLNWPARVSAQMAATLEVDPHAMHLALEAAVRDHLRELGELRPRID